MQGTASQPTTSDHYLHLVPEHNARNITSRTWVRTEGNYTIARPNDGHLLMIHATHRNILARTPVSPGPKAYPSISHRPAGPRSTRGYIPDYIPTTLSPRPD